jgi:hypothetical protein
MRSEAKATELEIRLGTLVGGGGGGAQTNTTEKGAGQKGDP